MTQRENKDYSVEIEGKYDLTQIELQIQTEEAGGSQFVKCIIGYYNNRITNIVQFEELPVGDIPKDVKLVKGSVGSNPPAPPSGTTVVWSGVMIVENSPQPVLVARPT